MTEPLTDAELDGAAMRATGVLTPRIVAELRELREQNASLLVAAHLCLRHHQNLESHLNENDQLRKQNAALTAALAKPLLKYDAEGERLLPDSWTPVDAGRLAELEEAERDNIKLTAAIKRLSDAAQARPVSGSMTKTRIELRAAIAEADRLLGGQRV